MVSKDKAEEMFLDTIGPFSEYEAEFEIFNEWFKTFEPETPEEVQEFLDELKNSEEDAAEEEDSPEKKAADKIRLKIAIKKAKAVSKRG